MTDKKHKPNIIQVSPEVLDKILPFCEEHTYTVDADLFYEGQVPVVAYLLMEGEAHLFKKRRKSIPLKKGDLFGIEELIHHTPSVYGARVKEGSQVCFISRSVLLSLLEKNPSPTLKEILHELIDSVA